VVKSDYAKWMVDDPRINFAISKRGDGSSTGVNHLGLQVDSDEELEALRDQAERADVAAAAEKGVNCCYATSNKYWYTDPTGVAWETYHTLGQVEFFGDAAASHEQGGAACCSTTTTTARIPIQRATAGACCK
jgi:hypothetical protein